MTASTDILRRNLAALGRTNPKLAQRIEAETPADLTWVETRSGGLTATVAHADRDVALASRYDPAAEATKLLAQVDHGNTAALVILGVGLGYHVRQALKDQAGKGVVIAYEPDRPLLRAVLERVDCTGWIGHPGLVLADSETTQPMLLRLLETRTGMLTQGLQIITHPPTRQRHAEALRDFGKIVTETVAYARTNVATTLVNAARTCSNLVNNLPQYAAGSGTDDLVDAAKGCIAVCVSAGPSLVKNVDLLRDPEVRSRVVVIAVQTALRPLLDRGVRPDFVTALDYSRISRRFYEGLPDLPDVTLVAEAKAHPAILDGFPGPIRCVPSDFNDKLLGPLARKHRRHLPSGTTVAHLSFYLAQHLGCDPICFIGQDLGFSDGLYYCPGTAIHQVWSSEMNLFNTVEMLEWTRIVRMRGHLRRAEDVHGRPIFTDEQMATYLKQFERDFADAPQTILDCTEGGMPKANTTALPLAEALSRHTSAPVPRLPYAEQHLDDDRLAALRDVMAKHADDVQELRRTTTQTVEILGKMLKHQRDPKRMDQLFKQLHKRQARVAGELASAFELVSSINTVGAFRRARADRQLGHGQLDDLDRQAKQIQRDLDNLQFVVEACDEALAMFTEARDRVATAIDRQTMMTAA